VLGELAAHLQIERSPLPHRCLESSLDRITARSHLEDQVKIENGRQRWKVGQIEMDKMQAESSTKENGKWKQEPKKGKGMETKKKLQ
jgi:hypothetical protein